MSDLIVFPVLFMALEAHGWQRIALVALAVLCAVGSQWAKRRKADG